MTVAAFILEFAVCIALHCGAATYCAVLDLVRKNIKACTQKQLNPFSHFDSNGNVMTKDITLQRMP